MTMDQKATQKPVATSSKDGIHSGIIVGQVGPATFLVQPGFSNSTCCCELAAMGDILPRKGDRVVMAADQNGQQFILGVVHDGSRLSARARNDQVLSTSSGATVEIVDDEDGESVRIRDRNQQLVFEYRPDKGKGHISLDAGKISLNAAETIDLTAGTDLRLFSGQGTRLDALGSVDLISRSETSSRIGLDRGKVQLSGETLLCGAEKGLFRINHSRLQGRSVSMRLESARIMISNMETVVKTLFEKATDVFRHVSGLHQLKARRTRTVCEDSHSVVAKRVRIDGNYSVKLQGDKIHLG
jgi:hypothetical protein